MATLCLAHVVFIMHKKTNRFYSDYASNMHIKKISGQSINILMAFMDGWMRLGWVDVPLLFTCLASLRSSHSLMQRINMEHTHIRRQKWLCVMQKKRSQSRAPSFYFFRWNDYDDDRKFFWRFFLCVCTCVCTKVRRKELWTQWWLHVKKVIIMER